MNILQILPRLDTGGVERGTADISAYISACKHKSIVVSAGGYWEDNIKADGGKVYRLPVDKKNLFTAVYSYFALKRILIEEDIDIVHARSRVPAIIAYYAVKSVNRAYAKRRKNKRIRFVTTCHGKYSRHIFSSFMAKGDVVITPSRFIYDYMKNAFGVDENRMVIIDRYVKLEMFPFRTTAPQKKIVLVCSRITPKKGQEVALNAFVLLAREYPDAELWFLGGVDKGKEEYKKRLKGIAMSNGIDARLKFLPPTTDVSSVMHKAYAVVVPSLYEEAFGRVAVEAQAAGVPVVASNVPALNEIIKDRVNGLLFERGNYKDLAEKLNALFRDAHLYRKLSLAGRDNAQRFNIHTFLEKTMSVYERLLNDISIVVIKYSAFGDIVLSAPFIKAVKKQWPRAKITVATSRNGRDLYNVMDEKIDVLAFDKKDTFATARLLRAKKPDIVFDLQNSFRSHLLCFLSRAEISVGFSRKMGKWLLTNPVNTPAKPPLASQQQLLDVFGIGLDAKTPFFSPRRNDVEWATAIVEANECEGKKLVGLVLSSSKRWQTKSMRLQQLERLIELLSNYGVAVVLLGEESDMGTAQRISERYPVVNFAGKTDIARLIAVVSLLDCVITPDTAVLHIAVALGRDVITYFGPTEPAAHIPQVPGGPRITVVSNNADCAPCYKRRCDLGAVCLKDIELIIADEVKKWLSAAEKK